MKNKSKNSEYKCFNENVIIVLYILSLMMMLSSISICIAVSAIWIDTGGFIFDGIICFSIFAFPLSLMSILIYAKLRGTKQGVFKINKDFCELNFKFKGENIYIKRNLAEIKRIEIRDFSETLRAVSIVFIDNTGVLGENALTKNGEYIKIHYTKQRLKQIKKYLPELAVNYLNSQTCKT